MRKIFLDKLQIQSSLFEEKELDSLMESHVYYGQDLPF